MPTGGREKTLNLNFFCTYAVLKPYCRKEDGHMDGEVGIRKAYEYILKGDYEQAVRWFEAAILADPGNADYYYKCSITCARSGKWAKALAYAEEAVLLDEHSNVYQLHLHTVQSKQLIIEASLIIEEASGELEEPVRLLQEALRLDPLSEDAYLLLGAIYGEAGFDELAVKNFTMVLGLNPQHTEAIDRLAYYEGKRRT
ncbi:hypothetical protein EBB07_19970 [Paenibacillaceae bacterium]|nr:hypothetical protein EBB07_19970 [Paenibacillaceae bacterium]